MIYAQGIKGNAHISKGKIKKTLEGECFFNGDVSNYIVARISRCNHYLNKCSGHIIGIQRKRKRPNNKRRGGGGFSFKPEIPWRPEGNGSQSIDDVILVPYSEICVYIEKILFVPKYSRNNHKPQSMPKIPWRDVRKWKNKKHKKFNTTKEKEFIKEQEKYYKDLYEKIPIPQFEKNKFVY